MECINLAQKSENFKPLSITEVVESWEEPSQSATHKAALAYAAAGIPIFPCVADGKAPACAHGYKDATTDVEQINAWWAEDNFNIGLCPEDAGWCVIDIDPGAVRPEYPETYEVQDAARWRPPVLQGLAASYREQARRQDRHARAALLRAGAAIGSQWQALHAST